MDPTFRRQRVLITGAGGLLGRAVRAYLLRAGAVVVPAQRRYGMGGQLWWHAGDSPAGEAGLSGFDTVIHLAGEPIAAWRWTPAKKREIYKSRVQGTHNLVEMLVNTKRPPRLFLSASGVNFYGDRGDTVLNEWQPKGEGFLADVCQVWEAATEPLVGRARVVPLRIGVVLAKEGGALRAMLPLFRMGLGGSLTGINPYLSWISLGDLVRAVGFLMSNDTLHGAVNLVSPMPVTNREFTATLGRVLHRPALLRVPPWSLKFALGQLAEETVLSSVRAVPARLLQAGFAFQDRALAPALVRVLEK